MRQRHYCGVRRSTHAFIGDDADVAAAVFGDPGAVGAKQASGAVQCYWVSRIARNG
jgi:hypothetical protein